ncbi:hypothetical protein JWG39_15740 [Desulforhopalus vacuolatus]|uniref:hypothetical protein n=1 Tax=Desulforhopalus vacuolatus TaxID=40414 RepID=UPI001966256B|nr:hypothetical protein [Desulforhopalus vacuolatus]MBM9521272.1 hypothetical protein [Desulforhopalus vacuolatus]
MSRTSLICFIIAVCALPFLYIQLKPLFNTEIQKNNDISVVFTEDDKIKLLRSVEKIENCSILFEKKYFIKIKDLSKSLNAIAVDNEKFNLEANFQFKKNTDSVKKIADEIKIIDSIHKELKTIIDNQEKLSKKVDQLEKRINNK